MEGSKMRGDRALVEASNLLGYKEYGLNNNKMTNKLLEWWDIRITTNKAINVYLIKIGDQQIP